MLLNLFDRPASQQGGHQFDSKTMWVFLCDFTRSPCVRVGFRCVLHTHLSIQNKHNRLNLLTIFLTKPNSRSEWNRSQV